MHKRQNLAQSIKSFALGKAFKVSVEAKHHTCAFTVAGDVKLGEAVDTAVNLSPASLM